MTRENVWAWARIILLVLLIRWLWFEPFTIPSGSMEPTLHGDPRFGHGDRVVVNKFIYGPRFPFTQKRIFDFRDPQRWDIVVFNSVPSDPQKKILIKRVVGLPGERVHIANGRVHVNGRAVDLPPDMPSVSYADSRQMGPDCRYGVSLKDEYSLVPPDHYLMLGDNSLHSQDSRFFGWVPRENLLGRAFCIFWPIARCRDLTGFSQTWWGMSLLYGIPLVLVAYEFISAFFFCSVRFGEDRPQGPLRPGDRLLVNRIAFGLRVPFSRRRVVLGRLPRRNEWIVFEKRGASTFSREHALGRVVGLPGDGVAIADGEAFVNGTLAGRFSSNADDETGSSAYEVKVLPGHVLAWVESGETGELEWVPRNGVVGGLVCVWWPFSRRRLLAAHGTETCCCGRTSREGGTR